MAGIRGIAILGSTGSLGRQALEVVAAFPERCRVVGLAAGRNASLLAEQVARFRPGLVSLEQGELPPGDYHRATPEEMVAHPEVDIVVVVTAGKAGLLPTLVAIQAGKRIALGNKEVLVMAGEVVMAEAARYGAPIVPVDSEHSALWQCLRGEGRGEVARLILTASGGPFLHRPPQELSRVTAQEALSHPTWRMGPKVTVDSATLMNKGMEVIEAHHLFSIPYSQIEVLIHPQSLVHSLVEFADGSYKAQLSFPDMRLPIQYALSYPERWPNPSLPRLGAQELSQLTFEPPDLPRFPCLRLAVQAGEAGGTYPAVLAAADEVAVDLFLKGEIGFLDIPRLIEGVLSRHSPTPHPSLEAILKADAWARQAALAQRVARK